jgi:hypothetical protein
MSHLPMIKPLVNSKTTAYWVDMIHIPEMLVLERRAHNARTTMAGVCKRAGIFPQSWYRARKRGSANYTLIDPLEKALSAIESDRKREKAK